MNEKNNVNKVQGLGLATFLIIVGILVAYIAQMGPAPVLTLIQEDLNLNLAQAGLGISIIFPAFIVFCLAGGHIEKKIGIKSLYIWTLIFVAAGLLVNYVANNFYLFLFSRILYAVGFGLGIPFIGAAIMKWYNPKQQELMNTVNGLFPFVGTMIAYGAAMPLYSVLGNSWRGSIAIYGFIPIIVAIIWALFIKDRTTNVSEEIVEEEHEAHLYLNLWRRPEIKLLCITFICDFFSYVFIASMLPTFYQVVGGAAIEAANRLAIVFPVAGLLGCSLGGIWMSKAGKRKPVLYTGQMLKFIGIVMAALGAQNIMGLLGVALVGIGNSMWMPPMYQVPMDLEDMTPTRVGATFAFISACGFAAGFISPVVGGWLSDLITMKWSLFAFAFPNLIGFTACLMIRETGPAAKEVNLISQDTTGEFFAADDSSS